MGKINESTVMASNASPNLGFYDASTAARLAQVPVRTVRSWDRNGIVPPIVEWVDERGETTYGYTFEGLVYLRLIRMMRELHPPFPLRKVVSTVKFLRENYGPPSPKWVEAQIVSDGNDIWVLNPVTASASKSGQIPFKKLFEREFALLAEREDAILIPHRFLRWVEIKPGVRNGMPVVRNTGIETSTIHAAFAQNLTAQEIKSRFPFLTVPQLIHTEEYEEFLDTQLDLAA
ncbi:MAG: DUF433 domain-containing protein [Chloroflexi bacterium]|nr:DUF433 domain-containing protein [Chloroflexota bacterium]